MLALLPLSGKNNLLFHFSLMASTPHFVVKGNGLVVVSPILQYSINYSAFVFFLGPLQQMILQTETEAQTQAPMKAIITTATSRQK